MGSIVSVRKQRQKEAISKVKAVSALSASCSADSQYNNNNTIKINGASLSRMPISKCAKSSSPVSGSKSIRHSSIHSSEAKSVWGEGVVSKNNLQLKGKLSSGGKSLATKSVVDSCQELQSQERVMCDPICRSERNAAIIIQKTFRGHVARKQLLHERQAALQIQRTLRGHQVRKGLEKQRKAAVQIQRHVRGHLSRKSNSEKIKEIKAITKAGHRALPSSQKTSYGTEKITPELKISHQTVENFHSLQEDINELKWQSEQKVEKVLMESANLWSKKFLLVSSNVPNGRVIPSICNKDIECILYNFSEASFDSLIDMLTAKLHDYKPGSKIGSIGFICQGGPGYMYLLKGKVCTKAKLETDEELSTFFQTLGSLISKLNPDQESIHFLGNDLGQGKAGNLFIQKLHKIMLPNKVIASSPMDISPEGICQIENYFTIDQYRDWKRLTHL